MSNKIEHLKMIQNIITRLSGNLFILKGWSVTLIVALLAVMVQQTKSVYYVFSFCVLFIFWILDGYFLSMEKCFRSLFDEVRKIKDDNEIDFSMDFKKYCNGNNTWFKSMISKTLLIFYGVLLAVMVIVTIMTTIDIKLNLDVKWKSETNISKNT